MKIYTERPGHPSSILAFTENNFNLGFIDQTGDNGYADQNTLDAVY